MPQAAKKLPADFLEEVAALHVKLIPLNDKLARIKANAKREGLDAEALDDEGFDEATRRLTARKTKEPEPQGLEGTPLGELLATHKETEPCN
jgi:hypothetical protein